MVSDGVIIRVCIYSGQLQTVETELTRQYQLAYARKGRKPAPSAPFWIAFILCYEYSVTARISVGGYTWPGTGGMGL
jgi:hypothetical protein